MSRDLAGVLARISRRRALLQGLVASGIGLTLACSATPSAAPAPPSTNPAAPPSPSLASVALASPSALASPAVLPPSPSPAALLPVRGAWVAAVPNNMVWPVAQEAGYFPQNGIDMDLSYINGSGTGVAALLSREIDMMTAAGSAVVTARAAGSDVIMVAGFLDKAIYSVIAAADIPSVEALRGKSVGVSKIGNADYFRWENVAQHFGWSMDDFQFVNGGTPQGNLALLEQGQVQGLIGSPSDEVAAEQFGGHQVFDGATLATPEQDVGLVVTREYYAAHADVLIRVIKASIQAMARWTSDPAFTQNVIASYLHTTDQRVTQASYTAWASAWSRVPTPSLEGMQEDVREVATQNPAAASVDPTQTFETSLVDQIQASGFIQQVYGAPG